MVAYYEAKVNEIASKDPHGLVWGLTRDKVGGDDRGQTYTAAPNVWLELYNEERDRLVKAAAAALRAGVEDRRVKLAETQGVLIAAAVRRILARLNLSEEQAALVPAVVPEELRSIVAEDRPRLEVVQ